MISRGLRLLTAAVVSFVAFAVIATAAGAAPQSPPPRAYVLVDAGTGAVLASANDHQALPPASTAKLVTALAAVEHLPRSTMINVSALAAGQPASKISMVAGERWHFDDTLASLMMVSANDAAYALAENTSGTVANFANTEAQLGKRLGMRDSTFADPAGLDDGQSFRGGPRMSAYDIAIAARNALAVPELRLFAAMRVRTFIDPEGHERRLVNHNKMLPGEPYAYAGMDGMKTGFTNLAGHTYVATATRGGRTLIAVILNTYDTYGWAAQLLDDGFAMPANAKGTGEKLPPVRVSPYGQRVTDQAAFLSLTGTTKPAPSTTSSSSTSTSSTMPKIAAIPPGKTGPGNGPTVGTTGGAGGVDLASRTGSGGHTVAADVAARPKAHRSWFTLRNAVIVLLLLLIAVVILRRRAVKRRRARRMAQRRAVAAAMRRGTLPVVDGKYRAGTRVGPPLDSEVRIHRREHAG